MEDTDREQNHLPVEAISLRRWHIEANNSKQSPLEAKTNLNESPIMVANIDLTIVVEHVEGKSLTHKKTLVYMLECL